VEKNIDYRGVFNLVHEAIFIHDSNSGRVIDVNDTCCRMFHCRRDDIIDGDPAQFCSNVTPFTPSSLRVWIKKAQKNGKQIFEWHARTIDGELFWVEVTMKVADLTTGRVIISVVRDIQKRKKMTDQLLVYEVRYRALVESSPFGFIIHQNGKIVYVNKSGVAMFGYKSAENLTGKPPNIIIAPDVRDDLQIQQYDTDSNNFIGNRFRTKGLRENGEDFDLEVSDSFYDDNGEKFFVLILRDVTIDLQRQKKLTDHMFYLNSMHRLSLVMEQYSADTHVMIDNTLTEIINIFNADRAFLLFRFDDEPGRIHVPFSKTVQKQYDISGDEIPDEEFSHTIFNESIEKHGFVELYRDSINERHHDYFDRLHIQSALFFLIDPKVEHKWVLGLHQCSRLRVWTDEEKELLQDISSRMAQLLRNLIMQDRVLHSEAQYQNLFQTIQDVYIRTDLDGNILIVSPSYENLSGYPLQDADRMNLKKDLFVFGEEFDNVKRLVNGRGIVEGFITRMYRSDKSILWISANLQAVYDADGIIGLEGIIRDITREKVAELALAEEKERLATTLQSLGEGVIATNRSGEIMLVNQAAIEMTGIPGQIVGSRFSKVIICTEEEQSNKKIDPISEVLKEIPDESDTIEISHFQTICLLHHPDEIKTISLTASPLENKSEECTGVVVVFKDITDRRKLELELQKRQKLESLGLMAGGIAHDFNNFLTGIMGNLELLRTIAGFETHIQEMVDEAVSATFRARDLTQQLLTFSKGGEPIKKSGDIGKLIRDTVMFPLRGSNINCELNMDDVVWPLEFDEGQINQAFNNIFINAKQAMPDGGIIKISLENIELTEHNNLSLKCGRYVKIVVKDEGVGITDTNLEKIFDPFFTTKQMGSGLGLSTTYSIVKKHNGMIEVKSEPGKWTEVMVYLPVSQLDIVTKQEQSDSIIMGNGSILIMDDEDMILNIGVKILTIAGYSVETAHHGEEALEMYRKSLADNKPYDVVILDITIPGGMGGAETLKRLQKLHNPVKAIVSSGYSTDPIMSDYLSYGFSGVVSKPYRLEDLLKTVSEIINQ